MHVGSWSYRKCVGNDSHLMVDAIATISSEGTQLYCENFINWSKTKLFVLVHFGGNHFGKFETSTVAIFGFEVFVAPFENRFCMVQKFFIIYSFGAKENFSNHFSAFG